MDFFMKIPQLNGNMEHLLLSSMIVYTFIGYFFHIPVYIYRVGMRRHSGTPVPSSCPRYPSGHKATYFSWLGPELFCLMLGPSGSSVGFRLLQCSSGVVRHPRDLQVSVATRCFFVSSQYEFVIYLFPVMIH